MTIRTLYNRIVLELLYIFVGPILLVIGFAGKILKKNPGPLQCLIMRYTCILDWHEKFDFTMEDLVGFLEDNGYTVTKKEGTEK